MKKVLYSVMLFTLTTFYQAAQADEGMWLPILLSQGPEAEMQRLGMKISAEDIFSMNKPSIKDAICIFGGGCTAEIVSDKGLILTNHHCGYSAVQAHSSVENDYLTKGFWANSFAEELDNPTLKISILVRMEDVTAKVLSGIDSKMSDEKRRAIIDLQIEMLKQQAQKGNQYQVSVEPFFYGNQYILVVYQIFKDIRLVGSPPSGIGKFGGDTDNWMWPRQTGDFSVFRIYTDKNNNPAEYSKDNVPYTPPYHLTISLKGVQPNDFTFVYGYPGTTQEYLTSYAVDRVSNYENPASIKIRGTRLDIFKKYMDSSKLTRIQYAAKYANVENYYKKMIGESKGVDRTGIIKRKQVLEDQFSNWANSDKDRATKYGTLINDFKTLYATYAVFNLAAEYLYEAGMGIECVRFASSYEKLIQLSAGKKKNDDEINKYLDKLKTSAEGYYKNYDPRIDHEMMAALLAIYYNGLDKTYVPDEIVKAASDYKSDFNKYADDVFKHSFLLNKNRLDAFLNSYTPSMSKQILYDPAYKLSTSIYAYYRNTLSAKTLEFQKKSSDLYQVYMQGLMEMQPDKKFYPDANSTLRVSYGKVSGFSPRDGVDYKYYTTLKGVIEKEDSAIYDYKVDDKLKNLYNIQDYGMYADKDGSMHLAFIATNHTTGGNSGSPVFNAAGQLIGINFDRVWEGTMSDIVYDPEMCRNISIDIRYCLFIIDKYAGAKWLIDEMTIVK
ncbi:MAG: S46 family peptidase [Bacteroidota bacterium]